MGAPRRREQQLGLGNAGDAADTPYQRIARESGHHLVDDDEIERLPRLPGAIELGHGLAAIERGCRRDAQGTEMALQYLMVHIDVIDDQDAEMRELLGKRTAVDGR